LCLNFLKIPFFKLSNQPFSAALQDFLTAHQSVAAHSLMTTDIQNQNYQAPPFHKIYSSFCVTAKVTNLIGLSPPLFLSPMNLDTFGRTQNGE
jgi:hypothetical protein